MLTHWLGLLISMVVLFLIARKNLPLAFVVSAVVLGLFTLPLMAIWAGVWQTVTDPSVLLLALAMGIIPMIGGVMEEAGQMDRLVNNLRIGKRAFLALAPALVGMLPVPGGALLSSPLVEKVGEGIEAKTKAALNVWFRHILFIVYPLSPALIASAKIAGLGVYQAIPYLFPSFIMTLIIGSIYYLRDVKGEVTYRGALSVPGLALPLAILLLAPVLDFVLQEFLVLRVTEWITLVAVLCSLGLAVMTSHLSWSDLQAIGKKMTPWSFALMIVGMFIFYNVFRVSGVSELIASLGFSGPLLGVVTFLLGVITGRVQLPTSVVIPTYLTMTGTNPMSPAMFSLVFFCASLGYMISPVHPCVSVSMAYAKVRLGDYLNAIALPTLLALGIALAAAAVL